MSKNYSRSKIFSCYNVYFLVKNYNYFSLTDHIIRIADIRKFNEPVLSLHGHKKAVSYVQFLSEKELVSA